MRRRSELLDTRPAALPDRTVAVVPEATADASSRLVSSDELQAIFAVSASLRGESSAIRAALAAERAKRSSSTEAPSPSAGSPSAGSPSAETPSAETQPATTWTWPVVAALIPAPPARAVDLRERSRQRSSLVESHVALARSLARRFANRGEELEDLEQVALLALVKAADRFDERRDVKFSTFASVSIVGELKRHFRDKRWGVHVTRTTQERYLAVRNATDSLTIEMGRAPTTAEVAARVGIEPEEVVAALEADRALRVGSLDAPVGDGGGGIQVAVHDEGFEAFETRSAIGHALGLLGDREREIVRLRFLDQLTQAEIGMKLGISQMQVSRLLSRSLQQVRAHLS